METKSAYPNGYGHSRWSKSMTRQSFIYRIYWVHATMGNLVVFLVGFIKALTTGSFGIDMKLHMIFFLQFKVDMILWNLHGITSLIPMGQNQIKEDFEQSFWAFNNQPSCRPMWRLACARQFVYHFYLLACKAQSHIKPL